MTQELDDDQHWLDLMAGRSAPEADARTRKEAAWLRAALLSYRVTAPPGAPAAAEARAGRLLARARDAGVLASASQPVPAQRKPANQWTYALAACVALFGVLLLALPGHEDITAPEPASGTWRGAAVQRIEAPDALQRRQQLLQDLRAAGFDAQPFERLGRAGIDLALPVPLPPAQAAALTRLGLVPPAGPSLQIEFITPPSARP